MSFQIPFKPLSSTAYAVFEQLFKNGPTWDGDILSKEGRKELIQAGVAFHIEGWASLTKEGVEVASMTPMAQRKINR